MESFWLALSGLRTIEDAHFVRREASALPVRSVFEPRLHFLYYQREGERRMDDGEGSFAMLPGDVILFCGGRGYGSYRPTTGYRAMNIQFSVDPSDRHSIGANLPAASASNAIWLLSRVRTGDEPAIRQLFEDVVAHAQSASALRRLKGRVLLSELLVELALRSAPQGTGTWLGRVEYAVQQLERHPDRKIDIDELAKLVGLSRRTLTRRFRESTGKSVQQYHLDMRLRLATSILKGNPDITLREVADTLGFYDEFHFSRTFKRHLGMSPAAFRAG